LIGLLPAEIAGPPDFIRIADLSPYATAARYPGQSEPVTDEEYDAGF